MGRQTIITLPLAAVSAQTNVLNRFSEIIDSTVPRTQAHKIAQGTPILLWLYTKETFSGSGSGGQVLALAEDLIDSPNKSDQQEAVVFVDGVLVSNYTIVHKPTNTVTSTGGGFASGADNVDVYYIWLSQNVSDTVRIRAADANKEKFSPLMTRPLLAWHEVDQYDLRKHQEIDNGLTLPEKTHFLFELNSDVLADFGADSPAYIEFAVEEIPMSQADPSTFVTFTE